MTLPAYNYGDAHAASGGNNRLREWLIAQADDIDTLKKQLGKASGIPPTCAFSVAGVDGTNVVTITNPQNATFLTTAQRSAAGANGGNTFLAQIIHELQSSLTELFDAAGDVRTYGPNVKTRWDITDTPNQTRFWRLRSSYDQVTWNAWSFLLDPTICGVVPVWSGLVRSSRSSIVDSATTPQGANPLTQHGTTTQIDVASSIWNAGDQSGAAAIHYNSGFVDPGSYGTWLVYASDIKRAGGTVVFQATHNSEDITSANGNIFFGKIVTAGGGGGSGSGGGGGTCCRGVVPVTMADSSRKLYAELRKGDILKALDGGPEVIQRIILHPKRPCFRLEFGPDGSLTKKQYIGDFTVYQIELDRTFTFMAGENGVIDGAAGQHPIQYSGGGFVDVFSAVVGERFSLLDGSVGSHNLQKV